MTTDNDYLGDSEAGALFSQCRNYRYTLWRRWNLDCQLSDMCAFVGLNPSTADETQDDPTIRRCIGFAKQWGYGGLVMLNLFALRATDPKVMKAHGHPIGPENNDVINAIVRVAGCTVAAWGTHGAHRLRSGNVLMILRGTGRPIYHLGLTRAGFPKHPLYLAANTERILW